VVINMTRAEFARTMNGGYPFVHEGLETLCGATAIVWLGTPDEGVLGVVLREPDTSGVKFAWAAYRRASWMPPPAPHYVCDSSGCALRSKAGALAQCTNGMALAGRRRRQTHS
jgi:hypothetical protein